MTFEPIWGSIIAWYLFLAGLGAGAFVASAFLRWKYPEAKNMRRLGHLLALIVVIIGLLLLMVDAEAGLHNPLRFVFLLSNFGSVMTWGVVFLAGFVLVALAATILDFLKKEVPLCLEIVGVICALCVAIYTGALLGVAHTFPLWNSAILPILFLVSAMSAGIAAISLVSTFAYPEESDRVHALKRTHFCLLLIEVLLLASLLYVTSFNTSSGFESVMSLLVGNYALAFWIVLVAIGLIFPIVLEAGLLLFSHKDTERSRALRYTNAGAEAGILIGGFFLRYLIIVAALPLVLV